MIAYPCSAQGLSTRVLEAGAGPAVVFVHGLGARADRWRHNLDAVAAAGYRCVAMDLPGHGFAAKSGDFPFSVPACASWLAALLDTLDIGPCALVGTSLGGYISAAIACAQPARVRALALVGTIGITSMGGEARAAIAARFGTVSREGIERKLNAVLFDRSLVTPAWIEEEWRINNSPGAQAAFARIAQYIADGIDDDVVGERLAGLGAGAPPIAVIWGREDRAVPVEVGHRARDLLRPAVYEEIPCAGHGPYLENPAAFNDILLRFLRSSGGHPPAAGGPRPAR
ncbi:hypothetical protein GCM10023144_27370 [Pigmentiphaga soli]|uniref:AB hydrolase-1 domain-containing protein n=1 Tax=Pigmentiphaga soli TaxID=1007095 RepID=A0ABP8H5R2_9BURK